MFDSVFSSVISIDPNTDTITFYTATGNTRTPFLHAENCRIGAFDDDFSARLAHSLLAFQKEFPHISLQKTALVLPDRLFLTDTISLPPIHRKARSHSLPLLIDSIYNNSSELKLNTELVLQNKKNTIFALTGIRKELLDRITGVCQDNHVGVLGTTFAANAVVNAAIALNSKLKGSSCLILDLKDTYARFSFVVSGRTLGYYPLPFGLSVLSHPCVVPEEMLFDHSSGKLLVLNALERARTKQPTVTRAAPAISGPESNAERGLLPDRDTSSHPVEEIDTPDNSPAGTSSGFAQRCAPQTRRDIAYENFRHFVKRALELISSNPSITALGAPEAVFVNLPKEYEFLLHMANEDSSKNDLHFAPLLQGDGANEAISKHLELFGGFFIHQFNKNNTF